MNKQQTPIGATPCYNIMHKIIERTSSTPHSAPHIATKSHTTQSITEAVHQSRRHSRKSCQAIQIFKDPRQRKDECTKCRTRLSSRFATSSGSTYHSILALDPLASNVVQDLKESSTEMLFGAALTMTALLSRARAASKRNGPTCKESVRVTNCDLKKARDPT